MDNNNNITSNSTSNSTSNNTNSTNNWDINSIIVYAKNHFIQILLLILAFFIIYVVDHITNINAAIYGVQQVVPGLATQPPSAVEKLKVKGKSKSKSKR